ncbi:MAG: hypothetical protein JWO78_522 [Micavibrio sp.]|nr:hypothetical protein [Micavibrio sp.]
MARPENTPQAQPQFKKATELDEVVAASGRLAQKTAASTKPAASSQAAERFTNIKANPFALVMLDPAKSRQEKKAEMTKLMTHDVTLSEEANEKNLASFTEFCEWLQEKRKELSVEMLRNGDTKAFGKLQEVLDQMTNGLLKFNEKRQPFLDILDALYKIQLNGVKTSDMIDEINKDAEETERLNKELEGLGQKVAGIGGEIQSYKDKIAQLKTETSWYTFGSKIKPAAQAEINMIEQRIGDKQAEAVALADKVRETNQALSQPRQSQFEGQDLAEAKKNLKALLDLNSAEHQKRQEEINAAAADFVVNSDKNVDEVLQNIENMNERHNKAGKNNSKMLAMFAIMNDSIKDATLSNQEVLKTQDAPADVEEDELDKLTREEKRDAVLRHIKTMTETRENTTQMSESLSTEKAELTQMQDSCTRQITSTRLLRGTGIANMASQLNAMMTALSSAATGQSSEVARELITEMADNSLSIRGKDSIRAALEFNKGNDSLEAAIARAEKYARLMDDATAQRTAALAEQKDLLKSMEQTSGNLLDSVKKNLEAYSDSDAAASVSNDNGKSATPAPAKKAASGGFGFDDLKI